MKAIDYLNKKKTNSEISERIQHVKQLNSQTRSKRSDDSLKLPGNFKVGQAIGGGDCFFDSVAQGLKRLKPEMYFTVKSLRVVCKRFAQSQLENDQSWLEGALRNGISEYVPRIEFTADDIEQKSGPVNVLGLTSPIWGRSEIEGRIICKEYNVKLHFVEKHAVEGKEVWLDQVVNNEGSKSVDSIDYSEENTIHIINRGNAHFEPILDTQETQYNRQQSSNHDTPKEELKIPAKEKPKKKSQDSEQQSTGLSSDRLKRTNNDLNADSSQQSSSDDIQSVRGTIDSAQHQQMNPNPPELIDSDDERGKNTDLFFAIKSGNMQKVQELLKAGVKVNIIDKNNKDNTPLHYAIERKKEEIAAELLQEWKADINVQNNKGDTPLHIATSKRDKELVQLLVSNGAKIDIKNNAGKSPLSLANELDNSNPNKQGIIQILETLLSSKTQIQPRQRTNIDAQGKQENRDDQRPGPSRQVNNPTQLHKQSSVKQHPEQSPSDNSNFYQKRSGTSGISGQLYETKLLMLILFRALNDEKINEFYLGTNVDGVGALDDIIFRYNLSKQEKPRVIFIQAKHRDDPDKDKVTVGEVQKKDGDFSLHKYLDSYLRIKQKFNPESDDVIFRGEFQNIDCDFVIYTPAKENFSEEERKEQPNTDDVLIYTSEKGKRFQFKYKDENIGLLVKIVSESHTKILAENFAKFIFSSTDNMMSDELIKSYHVVLAQKVVEVSDGKCKFRDEFFESKADLLRILKKVLYEKIVYGKKSTTKPEEIRVLVEAMLENTSPDTISKLIGSVVTFDSKKSRLKFVEKGIPQEVIDLKNKLEEKEVTQEIVNDAIGIAGKEKLASLSFKVPNTFGNLDLTLSENEKKRNKRLDHLTSIFINLLKNDKVTNNNVVKIDYSMVGPEKEKTLKDGEIQINGGIGGLVGNLLIFDEATSMLKFNNNEESLPKNAKQLFQKLKEKIEEENGLTNKKLDSYRFEINVKNFPRLSLIGEKHDKSLVREFLDKIKFFTNQAKEDRVEEILKQEISKYYLENGESPFDIKINTDAIFLGVHDKVQKWWKSPKEAPYLTKSCSYFNEVKDTIINNPILNILRIIYFLKIKGSDIEFSSDSIKELKLEDFVSDPNKRILNIIAKEKLLSAVKLVQNFETADFINLNYLYSLGGYNDYLEKAITELKQKGGENNILVIHCNDIEVERADELYNRLSSIMPSNSNKKVILITQEQDPLAAKFKKDYSDKYIETRDGKNSLIDLTNGSQNKLLSEGKVTFQGEEGVSLGTLVDDGSKHLIDGEVLSTLINHEKVKIGKALIDSKYEDIKDYYIPRTFNRQVKIKEGLEEKDSWFLVTYNRQIDEESLKENQDIVLISDTGEGFKDLCDNHKKHNIHWLKREGNDLIWQKSYGTLSQLRKFVDTNAQAIQEYKPEGITDIKDRVVIISAEPGMGKSTVLNPLALKTKDSLWVIRINLLDYSTALTIETEKKTKLNEAEAIKFLYRIVGFQLFQGEKEETTEKKGKREQTVENVLRAITVKDSKISLDRKSTQDLDLLEIELFNNFYNQGRIVLLFDGVDEISPDYTEKVIELLQVLKNSKVEKLWITTRPYNFIQEKLENQLSIFSYSLKPLFPEEQKDFLRKFWKAKLKLNELDEQRSGVFIDELLDKLPKSIGDKDFMSIPLHASMVAEVFTDAFKSFYDSNEKELSDKYKRKIEELDLVTLYERFIDIKFYKIRFGEKKPGMNIDDPDMKSFIENEHKEFIEDHMKLALYAMFNKDTVEKLLSQEEMGKVTKLIEKIKQGEERTGIIEQVIDNKPRLIHRTFAEYFVASYFWESFKSVQSYKFEGFVKSTIVKNLIGDDRIQICKFLQLKAKKDFESNIDFPDYQNKLRTLLTKLLDQTTKYDYNGNGRQSTKLLFGIVEFSFFTKEGSTIDVIQPNDQLKLLCVSAEMGYIKLANALETKLNTEFLQKYLRYDKWFYSPLWLAAKNAHLDVLEILVKKFSYDPNWNDKDSKTLVRRIFQISEFDVLGSCLKLDIVPYEDLNHRQELPIVIAFNEVAPSDVIKLLIEKTDSKVVNGFKDGHCATELIAVQSLKYGKEIIELALEKGIDFSDTTNALLFEYCRESLDSPINKLNFPNYRSPSFHSDEEFSNLFGRIELLLKAGVGYNRKDIKYSKTTLQYAEQIHYIHKLLYGVHKFHTQKVDKSSNPLGTILKLIIDNVGSSPDFKDYEFVKNHRQSISLWLNYKDKSYKYNREIHLLPSNIPKLPFEFFKNRNVELVKNALGELRNYITNAKEAIEAFKQYPDSKVYDDILIGYEEMFEFCLTDRRREEENLYKSLDKYKKDLLERVFNLYIRQDYEINDALKEVVEEVLRFKEIINKLEENSGHKKYETGEILDILAIKSIDTSEELQDLISKIYECGGIQFLSETWLRLSCIGQQRIMGILGMMFKFADQSSKILELLKKLDDSYKTLTKAIQNKNYQEINNILQSIESDFIKAVINGQDDEYGSPLHYAAFKGDVQVTKILLESGANPNLKMQGSGILLSTADGTQKDEDWEHDYLDYTPLHVAIFYGQLEVAKILVNCGAEVNAKATDDSTPLHYAAQKGYSEVVKLLLDRGADPTIRNSNEKTSLQYSVH